MTGDKILDKVYDLLLCVPKIKQKNVLYHIDFSENKQPRLTSLNGNMFLGIEHEKDGEKKLVFINNGNIVRPLWE